MEETAHRTRHGVVLVSQEGLEPVTRLALEQEQAQRWTPLLPKAGEGPEQRGQWVGERLGVVHDQQGGGRPVNVRGVRAFDEAAQVFSSQHSGLPSGKGGANAQQKLKGQPCLARARTAHQQAGGDGLRRLDPGTEGVEVRSAAQQGDRAVLGMEQLKFVGGRVGLLEALDGQPAHQMV